MTPRKHAELIKAWADGAEIEYFHVAKNQWEYSSNPGWASYVEYRIKIEPKPDVVVEWLVQKNEVTYFDNNRPKEEKNLRLTFDGETGALKSAEVL